MEKLYEEQEEPANSNVPELIKTFSDSLVFLTSANFTYLLSYLSF